MDYAGCNIQPSGTRVNRQAAPPEVGSEVRTADLIVSYPGKQFSRAKGEILRTLRLFGDPDPWVIRTSVWGIAIALTRLDNRDVIRRCQALFREAPVNSFRFAIKWVPVDHWSETDLPSIRDIIEQRITPNIGTHETWAMRVHKRRWERYHTGEIVVELARAVPRKVDLSHPDWLVWVDVLGNRTAVSLLRPADIFSARA